MLIKRIRTKLARLLIANYDMEIVQKSYFNKRLNKLLQNPSFFFIQVGAHDGVRFDDLYQKVTSINVHGIVIEPLQKYFDRLKMNYEDYPNVIPLNIALHPTDREVLIHHVDPAMENKLEPWSGGLGSIHKDHHNKTNIPNKYMITSTVASQTFMELITSYNVQNIDLLQIDVEGFDFDILKMIDFKIIKPKLIKYEYVNLEESIKKESLYLLNKHGYRVYIENEDAIGILNEDS